MTIATSPSARIKNGSLPARLSPLALSGLFGILLVCCGCASQQPTALPTQAQVAPMSTHGTNLVRSSADTLRTMRAQAPNQSLDYWLEEAQGVIILPGVYQAGFFYSIQGGEGVLVARKPDGLWSAPVFMSLGGAGFGIQAGLEKSRMVIVIYEREALDEILSQGLRFDVTAKYTILNIQEVTGPDSLNRNKPVIAVSDGVGIMAGVALKGGRLTRNVRLTADYYGTTAQQTSTLLAESRAPGLEVWELWDALTVSLPKALIQPRN